MRPVQADTPPASFSPEAAATSSDLSVEPPPALPADPAAAWHAASAAVGGLAGDFAAEAIGASWQDDHLAVRLPAQATTAAAFLRRPEVVTAISGALETLAGRRIRYGIVTVEAASEQTAAAVAEQTRPASVQTQAALLREAADHPLVAHARTLFDAAIRKVEPPRAREPRTAPAAVAVAAPPEAGVDRDGDANDDSAHGEDQDG